MPTIEDMQRLTVTENSYVRYRIMYVFEQSLFNFLQLKFWCVSRGCLTKPHIATNGAHEIRMKKFPNHTHNFTFSLQISHSCRFGAGDTYLLTGTRTAAIPNICRVCQTLRVHFPYLTYAFTMFTYQEYTVARMNYTIFMAIRTLYDQSKRTIRTGTV